MSSCDANRNARPSPYRWTNWFDWLSLCASSLCTLHCLALPLLFALLPALAGRLDPGESFHVLMLGLAVPTSLFALAQGWRRHRVTGLPLLGAVGLTGMAIGALATHSAVMEATWTILGSLTLAAAHIGNWRHNRDRSPA